MRNHGYTSRQGGLDGGLFLNRKSLHLQRSKHTKISAAIRLDRPSNL